METIQSMKDVSKIIEQDFVMIIAKTHSCSACKTIESLLVRNVNNIEDIPLYAVYVDDLEEFRGEHLVFSVPTVLIFSNKKELLRESRYINYDKIARLIQNFKA